MAQWQYLILIEESNALAGLSLQVKGKFHSCVTVDDRVFANVVFDTGAGTEKIHLCEFDSTYNTDMSGTYTGTAGVFDVSADFANGAVVNVISGNNYVGEFTVASGNVDVSSIDNTLNKR